jgi:hypothetical protein
MSTMINSHSPLSNDEVKNGGAIPPLPNISSRRDATLPFYLYGINKFGIAFIYGDHIKEEKKDEKSAPPPPLPPPSSSSGQRPL